MSDKLSAARLDASFGGWTKLVSTQEKRGTRIYMGGYSISYDRDGIEQSRTDNVWNCYLECHDTKTTHQMLRTIATKESG